MQFLYLTTIRRQQEKHIKFIEKFNSQNRCRLERKFDIGMSK